MGVGGYKKRGVGSLKEAVAELVAACGGQKRASELTRVAKSSIHRYTDDSDENAFTHMPVDVVRVLEKHCGEPIVTRWLAGAAGCAVVDLEGAAQRHEDYAVALSRIGRETGALFAEGCKHLSKGRVPPGAGRLKREAMALMVACAELLRDLGEHPP